MMKPKMGVCPECLDKSQKPIIGGKCTHHYWNSKRKPIKRSQKPISPRSQKRAKQERVYAKQRKEIMQERPQCQFPGCGRLASEIHHPAGRISERLTESELFVMLCHDHHVYVEMNPTQAKSLGLSKNRL